MDTDGTLAINELYDRLTVQGEGPSLGRLCTFVRLARCNLDCGEGEGATWCCDTPFTWRWRGIYPEGDRAVFDPNIEVRQMLVTDVLDHVTSLNPPLLVISGGEPLLQRKGLTALVHGLWAEGIEVEIETNGTQAPWEGLAGMASFNVSPKLSNSGVGRSLAWNEKALRALLSTGVARFKFVCADESDLAEVDELTSLVGIPNGRVWIMPAGTSRVAIRQSLAKIAEQAIGRRWNVTTRLHVELWGNQRGV